MLKLIVPLTLGVGLLIGSGAKFTSADWRSELRDYQTLNGGQGNSVSTSPDTPQPSKHSVERSAAKEAKTTTKVAGRNLSVRADQQTSAAFPTIGQEMLSDDVQNIVTVPLPPFGRKYRDELRVALASQTVHERGAPGALNRNGAIEASQLAGVDAALQPPESSVHSSH